MVVDGHYVLDIIAALERSRKENNKKPFMIIAKTFKGYNCGDDVENNMAYHGKPLGDKAEPALAKLNSHLEGRDLNIKNSEPTFTDDLPNGASNDRLSLEYTEYDA